MKKAICMFALLFLCRNSEAQNLIPNPSFEDTSGVYCGIFTVADFNSSINYWHTPSQGTPDIYSTVINQSCWNHQPNSSYGGPICLKGSQAPRTGNVFVGLGCYSIPGLNQREYIQSALTSPLIPGEFYNVEFYASLADYCEKFVDKLGAYFSDQPIAGGNDQPLAFIPQISTAIYISDTSDWIKISGTFQATSALNYITIGNFYDDSTTPTLPNPGSSGGPGCYGAYYYIDDVSVSEIKTTEVPKISEDVSASIYPNPFTNHLLVSLNNTQASDFIIYDLSSRIVFQTKFSGSVSINTEQFVNGIYLYEVRNKNLVVKRGKVVRD